MASSLKTLPTSFRKLVVGKLTSVFKDAVSNVVEPLVQPDLNQVLIRNRYLGLNANDIYGTIKYNSAKDIHGPFSLGFEGVGEVAAVGNNLTHLKIGQPVMYMGTNAFAEYAYVHKKEIIPVASIRPDFIPLLISGVTAGLSLDKCGNIIPGEKVLITAAAGDAGHIAVQYAKDAGCHVIGLCSTKEEYYFLKTIRCDHPINYEKENLPQILKSEYPNGVDVIWETVGGLLRILLMNHLAIKGRFIIAGTMPKYLKEPFLSKSTINDVAEKLLFRSGTLSGFLLAHYASDIPQYIARLVSLRHENKLRVQVDTGNSSEGGPFIGIDDIERAYEYLHSGKNIGKVVVSLGT